MLRYACIYVVYVYVVWCMRSTDWMLGFLCRWIAGVREEVRDVEVMWRCGGGGNLLVESQTITVKRKQSAKSSKLDKRRKKPQHKMRSAQHESTTRTSNHRSRCPTNASNSHVYSTAHAPSTSSPRAYAGATSTARTPRACAGARPPSIHRRCRTQTTPRR